MEEWTLPQIIELDNSQTACYPGSTGTDTGADTSVLNPDRPNPMPIPFT